MADAQESLRSSVIADLRQLAQEAKRPDNLITGWISGPEHPAIRDAAENVAQQLNQNNWRDVLTDYEATLKPFLMACDTKSPKLASLSLISLQKMLTRHGLRGEGLLLVIRALEQVERMNEEGVKLKMLQTALTLMQSTELAQNEEGVAAVLGVCFRLLADTKNSDSVLSTAMATVRQAVALVFEHVGSSHMNASQHEGSSPANGVDKLDDFQRAGSALLAQQGAANAALRLLDDLCMMATANEAMLKWLKAPSLPRVFVLDLLDFVLSNTAPVFRNIAAFEHALLVRVCQLLTTMLQNLLDPGCERSLQESDLRVVLRLVRTIIWHFHGQLRSKCGVFVDALLSGTSPECTMWQRMNAMVVLRQLAGNAQVIHFLFTTYDLKQESKLNAVTSMVDTMAGVVEAFVLTPQETVNIEAIQAVSALYQQKSNTGKEWLLEADYTVLGPDVAAAYLCMLAMDSILGFVAAVEALTDARTSEKGHVSESAPPDPLTCAALVDATWRTVLPVLSRGLAAASAEALVLQLLKAYSSFTQACGVLDMVEPRDAFLSSLCRFTLSPSEASQGEAASSQPEVASGKAELARRISTAGSAGIPPVEDAFVLTPKNVQALRTLFNVAHRLDHHLGRSWFMVLDTLNNLDRILHSPRTTTQEVSSQSGNGPHVLSSDLAILSTAANQLFESTSAMSTKACANLLVALREVSAMSLAASTSQAPGTPRLFALGRMVEVLLSNLHRLHDLWAIFLEHIVEALGDSRPSIRAASLEGLSKAIGGALASVVATSAHRRQSISTPGEWQQREEVETRAGAAEHMLLAALVELYTDAAENDVRLGLLRIALQALQRHGEQLSSGWEVVLRLLETVPKLEDAPCISLAFQSVQLVAADFMSNLPARLLRSALEVAALYAAQQADMNVSLTAINLLWNTADLLARRSVHSLGGAQAAAPSPVPNGNAPTELLDTHQFEELLRILFTAIQGMSTDVRPEVRNCAVRTLFLVVVGQGARLSPPVWEEVLWQLVFPLLRSVHHMAATSSREENQAEILGKVKGKSVPMVMHHSRNSQQKAWDETLVLALAGMGRLLRGHLPVLVTLPAFPQGWEELMLVLESSLAGGRREVALAAMAVLVTVMQAHGGAEPMARPMWKRALRATGVGVEAAASPQCMVPLQARLELVASVGQLHGALRSVLEAEDLHNMFGWLESLVKNPFSEDDSAPVMPGTLPPVQKAALQVFPLLVPLQHESLWGDFLGCLLRLLRPSQLVPGPEQAWEPGTKPSARDLKRWATSSLLMEAVLTLLVDVFREQVPWQQRAANMAALVTGVGECMATRFTVFGENLWRVAVAAFNAIVAIGLPAVNIACVNDDRPPEPKVWTALAQAFERFLLGGDGEDVDDAPLLRTQQQPGEASPSEEGLAAADSLETEVDSELGRSDADLEASVLDTLTDTVLTACTWSPEDARRRLVTVLDRGIARPPDRNLPGSAVGARFPQLCLRKYYVICSRGGGSEPPKGCLHEVAKAALPLMLQRAEQMLASYAAAASRVTADSPGALQTDDFLCMLEVLQALSVSPSVTDAALPLTGPVKGLVEFRRGQTDSTAGSRERLHLLVLYPALVACVTSPDARVRELIQDIIQHAGAALGLLTFMPEEERLA